LNKKGIEGILPYNLLERNLEVEDEN